MQILLDLLVVTLVSCAASCATGTEPDIQPSSADTPVAPHVVLPSVSPPGSSASTAPTTASTSTSTTSTSTSTAPTAAPPPTSSEVPGSYSLDVACEDVLGICLLSDKADKDVVFDLPAGMQRSSIVYTVTPVGPSAGGTVGWASQDVLDGTVHLHAYADAFSSVDIAVTGVMVVPQ